MARKRTDTADYFPHMARPGKTLFILEEKFGNDGYAFWFKLLEIITTAEGHYYDCSDETNWFFLLAKTRVSGITGSEILDILSKLGQIDSELWKEKKIIWIQGLIDNISDVYARRGRETPLKPKALNVTLCYIPDSEITPEEVFPNQKSPEINISESVIPKVKESKVKYIKDICVDKETMFSKDTGIDPQIIQEDFEKKFWAIYPARNGKKIGKEIVFKKFLSLSEDDRHLVYQAAVNFANSKMARDGIGIMDPIRFFKNKEYPDGIWREWLSPDNPPILTKAQGVAGDIRALLEGRKVGGVYD